MNISYLLYQAERPRTAAQQREADITAGQLAAAIARAGRSLRHPVTRNAGHAAGAAAPGWVTRHRHGRSCAVPRPREAR